MAKKFKVNATRRNIPIAFTLKGTQNYIVIICQ